MPPGGDGCPAPRSPLTAALPSAGLEPAFSVSAVGTVCSGSVSPSPPPLPASEIVIRTEFGLPAATPFGRVPSATVNLSSSVSVSCAVVIVPVPVVFPRLIVMLDSGP